LSEVGNSWAVIVVIWDGITIGIETAIGIDNGNSANDKWSEGAEVFPRLGVARNDGIRNAVIVVIGIEVVGNAVPVIVIITIIGDAITVSVYSVIANWTLIENISYPIVIIIGITVIGYAI
jgi:hypothetical protein